MKSGKRHLSDRMELPNQDIIRTLGEKETYKNLGILEGDTIKQVDMKGKILKKEYPRRTRNLLETNPYSRNLIEGINTWAVLLVRYTGPFLKWTTEELKQMDQWTRKLMTMCKALHPRDYVDRLYVSRKDGGSVDASIQRLERNKEKRGDWMITSTRNNTDDKGTNRTEITRKTKMKRKTTLWTF